MRAVWVREFGPIDRLEIVDVPEPAPGPRDVVVDVVAADVNYPDWLVVEGRYQHKPPLPFSPGKGAAGRVSAIGAEVDAFRVGDRVLALVEYGAHAERLCAPANGCFPIPDAVPFDVAAALGVTYQTASFALKERARMKGGEVVLVLGASGGVGSASVQMARAFGATQVLGGVRGAAKVRMVRDAGADHTVDFGGVNPRDEVRNAVRRLTSDRGADIVIDPVGGEAHEAALRAVAWCGRMVIVGFTSGTIPAIKANYLLLKNIEVAGLQWSDYRDRTPDVVSDAQREIFELYLAGRLAPHISATLPLDRVREALHALRDGRVQGKWILDVAAGEGAA